MLMMYSGKRAAPLVVDEGYVSSVGSISLRFQTLIDLSFEQVTRYRSSKRRFKTDSVCAFSISLIICPVEKRHRITLQSLPPETTRSCSGRSSNCRQSTEAVWPTSGLCIRRCVSRFQILMLLSRLPLTRYFPEYCIV